MALMLVLLMLKVVLRVRVALLLLLLLLRDPVRRRQHAVYMVGHIDNVEEVSSS